MEAGKEAPEGYSRIPYHIVYDVKWDGRRKARLVANGNMVDQCDDDIYSSVVSIESSRTGFLISQLNDINICAGDISNTYLFAKAKEKVYFIAGKEFGKDMVGRVLIIDKALYGLSLSGFHFHQHLANNLKTIGFLPNKSDQGFWMRDRGDHYEYIACYVDDIMIFSRDTNKIIKDIEKTYSLKGVGYPEYYLGGNTEVLGEEWTKDALTIALSSETYVKNVIPKFVTLLKKDNLKSYGTSMSSTYHPEIDESNLIKDNDKISLYRSTIGSLNWLIVLGRFDILYATSTLSRYNMAPREEHFDALIQILGYLQDNPRGGG